MIIFFCVEIGFIGGLLLGIILMQKTYEPYIKELKGYTDYWYNAYRTK